jgi:hypothetical protein
MWIGSGPDAEAMNSKQHHPTPPEEALLEPSTVNICLLLTEMNTH